MKEASSTVSSRVSSIPPANMFALLRAAYGSKLAERIFSTHGLSRPVNPVHRRSATGPHAFA